MEQPKRNPVCPECKAHGINYMIKKNSLTMDRQNNPEFEVVYCSECGHVYGVLQTVIVNYNCN